MYLYLIMKKMFHEITLKRLYVKFFLKKNSILVPSAVVIWMLKASGRSFKNKTKGLKLHLSIYHH